jgi:hypothetical protein
MVVPDTIKRMTFVVVSFLGLALLIGVANITNGSSHNILAFDSSQNILAFDSSQNILSSDSLESTLSSDNLQSVPSNFISADISVVNNNSSYQSTTIPDPWGYGYFTHPSIIWSSIPVFGHHYWLSITPYPYVNQSSSDNQKMETPCLYYSDDGFVFKNASGIKNPFAGINPLGYGEDAYGSDPEIVYNPDTKQMYCYYVIGEVFENLTIEDVKLKIYNGKNLSQEYNCSGVSGVSPAVLYDNKSKKFYMWIVDINYSPHQLIRYDSEDGINFTNKTIMDMSRLYKEIWHLDVSYNEYDRNYYMFITFAGCPDLWLARTTSITSTYVLYQPDPIINCADITDGKNSTVFTYRSSGVFKGPNTVGLWIPAQRESDHMWRTVFVTAERKGYQWKYSGKNI